VFSECYILGTKDGFSIEIMLEFICMMMNDEKTKCILVLVFAVFDKIFSVSFSLPIFILFLFDFSFFVRTVIF